MTNDGLPLPHKPNTSEVDLRDARTRDLAEMNHRITNSLQLLARYLTIGARKLGGSSSARSVIDEAVARVMMIADLHRQIGTHVDTTDIDLTKYLAELCPKITGSTGVEVSFVGESVDVSFPTARRIAQIVTELAINAGKHAGTVDGAGLLRVDCRCDRDHLLRLTLSDDGPELEPAEVPSPRGGLGLALVAAVVEELDGRLEITRGDGTTFELTVPLH